MIISCEKCYTKFNLDENLVKQTGSKVRCSKCQNIFLAYPPTVTEKPAEPPEEIVGFESVDSDEVAESVEQDKSPEEETKATFETEGEKLDLSNLDLEEGMEPKPEVKEEPEELPELDLDTGPVAEEKPEEPEPKTEITEEPESETEVKEEPEEFELDLDTEPVAEEKPEELEAVVDKEEIEKEAAGTVALGPQVDQMEKEEAEKSTEADVKTEEASITTEQETTPARKKRISTPVLVVLIIVLLTGGAYGTYTTLKSMNIKIPFISDLVKPPVQDESGNLQIIAFDIVDKFIANSKIGKLFIISGKVKNQYSGARSFIKITGKLYAKERALSKTATVSCGNVLSDQDLSNMDINSINKRLSNLFGDNKSNVNVTPGKELPFMIVFQNIPDNIEEYTIEIMGSSPS